MLRLALKQYRLHFRDAYLEVDSRHISIRVPSFFGSQVWTVPTALVVACDLTAGTPVSEQTHARMGAEPLVFERAPLLPYLFTTGPMTSATTALLFRTPQRVPVLTRVASLAPNVDLGFTRRQTRSSDGVAVDGFLVRVADPVGAIAGLRAAGIESTDDVDQWLLDSVPTVTDAGEAAARIALEGHLRSKDRWCEWAGVGSSVALLVGLAADIDRLVAVGLTLLGVSMLGRFLIRRRLLRP